MWLSAAALGWCSWQIAAAADQTPVADNGQQEAQATFDLLEIQVEGNSVLDTRHIEKTVYPFLGPKKGVADVESARQALEDVYHQAGYQTVFVNIPEQDVEGGVVKLEVAEGKVDRLKVTGSRYYSLGRIRERVPQLAEGNVPHAPTLQKELSKLSDDSRDRKVTPILRAGLTPGTIEAELKVEDELPLHGSLEMNGRNSEGTSRSRLVSSLRYDNLWQRYHSASLQFQTAPEAQDVEVWAGTYVMPLFDDGLRMAFYGVGISSSSQVASAGDLSVVGSGHIFGARFVKPLDAIGDYSHSLTAGFDYKSFDQNLLLRGADTGNNPLTYVPFMARYEGGLRVEGQSFTSFGLETKFSVRGLGNDQQEFTKRRPGSRSDFIYVAGDIKHQQILPADLRLVARGSAQISNSPLVSNEQFAAGGDETVRGYHEVQELGDHGIMGSLELHSPQLGGAWESVQNLRLLTFLEGARLWIEKAPRETPNEISLASAGLGMRMQVWKRLSGALDWAYPMIKSGTVRSGEQRLHFRLTYEF